MPEDKKSKMSKKDEVALIAKIDIEQTDMPIENLEGEMPVLPLRNMIIFPEIVMPVAIGRRSTLELVKSAYKKKLPVILATQKDAMVDEPNMDDLYPLGVVGRIVRILELPGGATNALIPSPTTPARPSPFLLLKFLHTPARSSASVPAPNAPCFPSGRACVPIRFPSFLPAAQAP